MDQNPLRDSRFFLSLFLLRSFDMNRESQVPGSLEELERLFEEAHVDASAYVSGLDDAELSRTVDHPMMREFRRQCGTRYCR